MVGDFACEVVVVFDLFAGGSTADQGFKQTTDADLFQRMTISLSRSGPPTAGGAPHRDERELCFHGQSFIAVAKGDWLLN